MVTQNARSRKWVTPLRLPGPPSAVALGIGVTLGATAGYMRGIVGTLIMRFTDMIMAFPTLLLAIALAAILRVETAKEELRHGAL